MKEFEKVARRVNLYVRGYLKETGKKQEFLAKELGYTPKRFSLLINGKATMGIDDLLNIARYFRIPVSNFLDEAGLRPDVG